MAAATSASARRVRGPARLSGVRLEVLGVAAVTVGVGVLYALIDAVVLNTPGYLDPWIYYALFQSIAWSSRRRSTSRSRAGVRSMT